MERQYFQEKRGLCQSDCRKEKPQDPGRSDDVRQSYDMISQFSAAAVNGWSLRIWAGLFTLIQPSARESERLSETENQMKAKIQENPIRNSGTSIG